jgi:hypothetical protein
VLCGVATLYDDRRRDDVTDDRGVVTSGTGCRAGPRDRPATPDVPPFAGLPHSPTVREALA